MYVAVGVGICVVVGLVVAAMGLGVNVEQPVSRKTIIRMPTPELNNLCLFIIQPSDYLSTLAAQRLAAQRLGHDRSVVTILIGNIKLRSSVLSLSLGQVS